MIYVVAFDPGKTCGVATWWKGDEDDGHTSFEEPRQRALHWLENVTTSCREWGMFDLHVVHERFTISMGTVTKGRDAHWPLGAIGTIEYLCARDGVRLATPVSPASAKTFMTNQRLNAMGWRNRTPGEHADDAARVLGTYLAEHKLIDLERFRTD